VNRRIFVAASLAVVVALIASTAVLASSGSKAANGSAGAKTSVSLVSDIGKFNDRSFNQSQLEGLKRAKAKLGVNIHALQSNSTSDYIPNLTQAIRTGSNLIISAGFLLADDTNTVAQKYPNTHFAITDYSDKDAPFSGRKNVEGLTYAANESGCLVGYLAAEMVKKQGGPQVIGAVGGLKIPPVDIWIAGYRFCAQKAVPGTKVLIQYSQDFVATDKCKTVATNEISQGAKVVFQVAGGCGVGVFKAADAAGAWAIGVDVDQYKLGKRVLTSGVKRVDNGVIAAIKQELAGKFKGGNDLNFNLKNGGMGIGKINPSVPKAYITLMNGYKKKIINGTLKVPSALK